MGPWVPHSGGYLGRLTPDETGENHAIPCTLVGTKLALGVGVTETGHTQLSTALLLVVALCAAPPLLHVGLASQNVVGGVSSSHARFECAPSLTVRARAFAGVVGSAARAADEVVSAAEVAKWAKRDVALSHSVAKRLHGVDVAVHQRLRRLLPTETEEQRAVRYLLARELDSETLDGIERYIPDGKALGRINRSVFYAVDIEELARSADRVAPFLPERFAETEFSALLDELTSFHAGDDFAPIIEKFDAVPTGKLGLRGSRQSAADIARDKLAAAGVDGVTRASIPAGGTGKRLGELNIDEWEELVEPLRAKLKVGFSRTDRLTIRRGAIRLPTRIAGLPRSDIAALASDFRAAVRELSPDIARVPSDDGLSLTYLKDVEFPDGEKGMTRLGLYLEHPMRTRQAKADPSILGGGYFVAQPDVGGRAMVVNGRVFSRATVDGAARKVRVPDDSVEALKKDAGPLARVNLVAPERWTAHGDEAVLSHSGYLVSLQTTEARGQKVGGNGSHLYAQRVIFEGAVKAQVNPRATSNPRGKMVGRGVPVVGKHVGTISVRGRSHPLFDEVRVVPRQ